MNRKIFILPIIAVLLFFLPVMVFGITAAAEKTEVEIIDSGSCGKMHYNLDEDDEEGYLSFEADESVRYSLYEDGTIVISGTGEMGNFNTWLCDGNYWYKRKKLIPWYDNREVIRKVVVEDGVTSIGSAAFYGCKNLESIEWAESIENVGDYAFYKCLSLKNVRLPSCNNLESIQWADSIEHVGDYAFYKCRSLKNVRLPSCVKEWGVFVFAECKGLKKVTVDKGFKFRVSYLKKGDWDYIKGVEKFFPIISGCDGYGMFRNCTSLEEVKLPKDSLVIPSRFVEGCTRLKTFTIPDKVAYWGSCPPSLLKGKYVLPDSVRILGDGAFAGCSDLEELILPEGLVYMYMAFEGCSSLKTLKIPKSVRKLGRTFYNCTGLESIVIPETVKDYSTILYSNGIFEGCSNLKSVVLPKNMTKIGHADFMNCSSLKKITLPPKLKEIGESAFDGCSSLNGIKIPGTVKEIGRYAFYGCTSLEEIDIPKGVYYLGYGTFYNCKNLKSVTIREKKQMDFGEKVFYGCKNLSKITLYAKASWMNKHAFDGIPKGVTVYVTKDRVNKFKKQFRKAKIDMSNIDIRPMK